jgi:hypothetical protein
MKKHKYEEDLTAFPQKSHTEKDFPVAPAAQSELRD